MRTTGIRPVLAHFRMPVAEILPQAHAAYAGLKGNADSFPKPPVDLDVLKETTDQLTEAAAAALDGGSIAIAARNRLAHTLVQMLRQLARYVEGIAYDDLPKFISSGFQSFTSVRVPKPPLNQAIRRIDSGINSGQVVVNLVAVAGAHSYELRWASVDNGTTGEWTT